MSAPAAPIVIAGGGIGGLATALALADRGIASIVCERRAAFSEDGAGIQIGPNAARILQQLGAALSAVVAAPDALSVRNGLTGAELTRLPLGRWIAERHGAPYWTAHRKDLHAALLARADAEPLIELRYGVEIATWAETADGVDAIAADNARILVAADGLWSRLRSEVSGAGAPTPVGKSAYRCVVPASDMPDGLAANAVHIWLAPGAHAVHYPVRHGREFALVLIVDDRRRETGWNVEATPDLANENVARFAPALRALLKSGSEWRAWSLHTTAPLPTWTKGRVALLGDAAHPILPFLAQGAALALEDAIVLADCLALQSDDVAAALSRYASLRMARANRVAAAAARNGRIYHLGGPLALARNAVLRASKPERLMAGYDWLYGWRASLAVNSDGGT